MASAFDMVGWYIDNIHPQMDPTQLRWDYYTHIVVGNPHVDASGMASCNRTDSTLKFVALGKQHNTKIVWRAGIPSRDVWMLLENATWMEYKMNYLHSIGQAVADCGVDGIEFDYECPPTSEGHAGIVTDWEATQFTLFLADVKQAMGGDKQISCDMGVWGVTRGSYPLMFRPWLNVSMVAAGAIDYINTMSYHYPGLVDEVFPWEKDAFILHDLWGFPKDRINIGLPYFFHNGSWQEPLWSNLSVLCPNIAPNATHCEGVHIISKDDNYLVGQFIKSSGFRGAFPWAANFDSLEFNNTLVDWLYRGLHGE
jgi:hypothetical protein